MKNIIIILIMSSTFSLLTSPTMAQKSKDSTTITESKKIKTTIEDIKAKIIVLDNEMTQKEIKKKFPEKFQEIKEFEQKTNECLDKAEKKRTIIKKWEWLEKAATYMMFMSLIYNDVK